MIMESMRAYYEYPPTHANMPAREYGGGVTISKSKRSLTDLLKFRSRTKERQLSPAGTNHTPHHIQPAEINYMAEYRQKYGAYNGTVGRSTSYQSMTVVKSISPPPLPVPNNKVPKGYPKHHANGYHKHGGSGTVSAATGATMASTVRYTDWFGSVVGRRPPVRPPLPSFGPPPIAAPLPEKGGAWDHYVTLDPVYESPCVVPVQLYSNVCLCPNQLVSTKGRKKKKCKRCGNKIATVRHATTTAVTKTRPALPLSMYQPGPMPPTVPTQHSWGWQVLEERVYERCEVAAQPYPHIPAHSPSDDDESPPPTPETVRSVRSVRSARSAKSSDSSATITRDCPEPSRPAPPLPNSVRALPPPPESESSPSTINSAKESTNSEKQNARNSILLENPSAYQLISRYKQPNAQISSDTDELSDNAIDTQYDEWDTDKSSHSSRSNQGKRVNVINIGDSSSSSPISTSSSLLTNVKDINRIHIDTGSSSDQMGNMNVNSATCENSSSQSSSSTPIKTSSSNISLNFSSNNSLSSFTSQTSCNSKRTSSSAKIVPSPNRIDPSSKMFTPSKSSSTHYKNNSSHNIIKNKTSSSKNSQVDNNNINNKNVTSNKKSSPHSKEALSNNLNSSLSNYTMSQIKKDLCNGNHSSSDVTEKHNSGVKKLHDSSELQKGGNTVRIAGQRMFVLGPGAHQPDNHSGFSSCEEDDTAADDDTSDYPVSSPTTQGSDTDTLPEEENLPLDSSISLYNLSDSYLDADAQLDSTISPKETEGIHSDRWIPARDTIYEEEEDEVEENQQNQNSTDADEDSTMLGEEDDKDTSISSSSTSSPTRNEGPHPTLSELLKVKSILKKPPSVDTSSETDSDFYLPTYSEFKQNQRKKKQVQFRSSHEVTVIEDAGESKGRKVSSVRNSRREREKAKEKQKNNYNLIADLQDIYARGNFMSTYQSQVDNECNNSRVESGMLNFENAKKPLFTDSGENIYKDFESKQIEYSEQNFHSDGRGEGLQNISDGGDWDACQTADDNEGEGDHIGHSIHRSLDEHQTPNENTLNFQDSEHLNLAQNSKSPLSAFSTPSPTTNVPTRQAPPPPKSRTLSPPRPNVPPPPPPTSYKKASPPALAASSLSSPGSRPLPSPPVIPQNYPLMPIVPSSPPPSPTPPPLPTSPPPMLDGSEDTDLIIKPSQNSPSLQNPTFHSFKSDLAALSTPVTSSSTIPKSPEKAFPTSSIREVLPPPGSVSVFGNEEEIRTATIRGRGAAHTRSSILSAFSPAVPSTTPTASSPPTAPRRRNRNRSLSPDTNDTMTIGALKMVAGRGRRMSFLNSLVGDENPYEQITDHIYEELLSSHSPSYSSSLNSQNSPRRSSPTHKSPSPGKSMFEGASKHEILEYLQDARRRVAISAEDDEEEDRLQGLVTSSLEAEMDMEDEEEDQLGVEPAEDHFASLTSRNRGYRSSNMSSNSDSSENSGLLRSDKERLASGEIERTDSGVGSETSKPSVIVRRSRTGITSSRESDLPLCDDCDSPVDTHITNSGVVYAPLVCRRCSRRRQERKEILTEIMETEIKYGRDLRVMIDEFYRPILVAGLLTRDQLSEIFLNVEELQEHNRTFSLQLRDALEIALDQGDEDLLTVNVAKLFLHAAPMLHAFENYCVRHGSASLLLQTLEKEKELLRIFLKVSQMENTLLRRMNLHSFLMVPVQRVTKYPLLLARLYKTTPPTHPSREDCRRAKEKIELHLQHMNNETKEVSPTKLWRRFSMSVGSATPLKRSLQPHDHTTNLKLRKLALEVLEWSQDNARVVREGRLFCLAPDSNNWTRRGRSLKMASVHVLLITQGTPQAVFEDEISEDGLVTPRDLGIRDAAVLAFKDHKVSKAALMRQEPWILSRCVIAWEAEGETECFEITDLNSKDTFIFKGSDSTSTEAWFRYIQFHALSVGMWKRRRPALANIMINGMHRN
ncbi:dentin sialophosphoprotein-like isoform X1 [Macrobrachium nipponense]|uniref:dentin sialophosphoprotein-like isoform X1 n=1 Tax=Macrobrachium nipponense TaxID=159736 RepID=UPI0030C84F5C